MKKLKIILQSRYLIKILAAIFLTLAIIYTKTYNFTSKYQKEENTFTGIVTKYELRENKLILEIKTKEKLIVHYKYEDKILSSLSYGDKLLIKGVLKEPSSLNIPNTFNYKKYLYNKKIYYIVDAYSIDKIENNNNYLYTIKNTLYKKINNLKSADYIKTLLFGDNTLSTDINNSYRINGISHLFSVSGMHINIITSIIYFYLNKITYNKKIKYIITDIFLLLYLIFVGTSSILRSTIMNILFSINFMFKLNIGKIDILFLTLIISIVVNPSIIYDLGFIYSYLISFFLIMYSPKTKSKLKKVIYTSFISFIVSFPITIYSTYEINIISIILNIILVPIISTIILPLTILTLVFPIIDNILFLITNILEEVSLYISQIEVTKFIFPRPSRIYIIIYYIISIIVLKRKKRTYLIFGLIIFQYLLPYFNNNLELTMFDVGEADSILITYPHIKSNILIDTGKTEYTMINGIIPYLKSKGIKKINYLIITHGDLDHIGGALTLTKNFKVENIILNNNDYTELELELIENNKNIIHNNVQKIKTSKNYLYFLNNQKNTNENDSSLILYFEY